MLFISGTVKFGLSVRPSRIIQAAFANLNIFSLETISLTRNKITVFL